MSRHTIRKEIPIDIEVFTTPTANGEKWRYNIVIAHQVIFPDNYDTHWSEYSYFDSEEEAYEHAMGRLEGRY